MAAAESGVPTETTVALAIADKKSRLSDAVKEEHGKLTYKRVSCSNGSGFGQGSNAGSRADLGAGQLS